MSNFAKKGHPENDLYCVGQDVKPYSLTRKPSQLLVPQPEAYIHVCCTLSCLYQELQPLNISFSDYKNAVIQDTVKLYSTEGTKSIKCTVPSENRKYVKWHLKVSTQTVESYHILPLLVR